LRKGYLDFKAIMDHISSMTADSHGSEHWLAVLKMAQEAGQKPEVFHWDQGCH
jgi:hypothetical protein